MELNVVFNEPKNLVFFVLREDDEVGRNIFVVNTNAGNKKFRRFNGLYQYNFFNCLFV
jgi:hypothetical protein